MIADEAARAIQTLYPGATRLKRARLAAAALRIAIGRKKAVRCVVCCSCAPCVVPCAVAEVRAHSPVIRLQAHIRRRQAARKFAATACALHQVVVNVTDLCMYWVNKRTRRTRYGPHAWMVHPAGKVGFPACCLWAFVPFTCRGHLLHVTAGCPLEPCVGGMSCCKMCFLWSPQESAFARTVSYVTNPVPHPNFGCTQRR